MCLPRVTANGASGERTAIAGSRWAVSSLRTIRQREYRRNGGRSTGTCSPAHSLTVPRSARSQVGDRWERRRSWPCQSHPLGASTGSRANVSGYAIRTVPTLLYGLRNAVRNRIAGDRKAGKCSAHAGYLCPW